MYLWVQSVNPLSQYCGKGQRRHVHVHAYVTESPPGMNIILICPCLEGRAGTSLSLLLPPHSSVEVAGGKHAPLSPSWDSAELSPANLGLAVVPRRVSVHVRLVVNDKQMPLGHLLLASAAFITGSGIQAWASP